MSNQPLLQIYSCGGAGINQVAGCENPDVLNNAVYADCSMSDASRHEHVKPFIFQNVMAMDKNDVDGSGKVRKKNLAIIRPQMPKFFKEHQPGKYNIIVASDCGGTGAIVMHLIVAHLIELGLPFVVLLTGNQGSLIECSNSVDALEGLNTLGLRKGVGIPLVYHNNHHKGATPSTNDRNVREALKHLTKLCIEDIYRLDTEDKTNFFCPTRVTMFEGGLLEVFLRVGELKEEEARSSVLSMLSIVPGLDFAPTSVSAEYSAVGEDADVKEAIHFILGVENIAGVINFLEAGLAQKEEEARARAKVSQGLFSKRKPRVETSDIEDDLIV